jgi:hypothetical protein
VTVLQLVEQTLMLDGLVLAAQDAWRKERGGGDQQQYERRRDQHGGVLTVHTRYVTARPYGLAKG